MGKEVVLSVRTDLTKAIESLQALHTKLGEINDTFKQTGDGVSDGFQKNTKKTETFLGKVRGYSMRLADQIRKDFTSLVSIGALAGGLKLSSQFAGSLKQTLELNDAIRKLGGTFGVAQSGWAKFQNDLTRGLGDIGMSSDVAARALEGLAETPVRGTKNIVGYAKAAGELASIGGEQGKEAGIAQSIARVIQARGGNVNDMKTMEGVSQSVLAARQGTGAAPSEILHNMEKMFSGMSQDLRKTLTTRSLATIAGASTAAGPNATAFIEQYMRLSQTQRAGLDARGGGSLFGANGFNAQQIRNFSAQAKGLGGGDMRLGLKAMGIESDEAAEGFMRLVDNLDGVVAAQDRIQKSNADLTEEYRRSLGMGEAFRANINKVKGVISGPLSYLTQGMTDVLAKTSSHGALAAGTVAGGGILAAMLAGGGLRGIGKGLGGMAKGSARGAAEEALTGEKSRPVHITNWAEMPGGMGVPKVGGAGAGAAIAAAGAGMAVGAVVAGTVVAATKQAEIIQSGSKEEVGMITKSHNRGVEMPSGNTALEKLFDKLTGAMKQQKPQKVVVGFDTPALKETKSTSRGASF